MFVVWRVAVACAASPAHCCELWWPCLIHLIKSCCTIPHYAAWGYTFLRLLDWTSVVRDLLGFFLSSCQLNFAKFRSKWSGHATSVACCLYELSIVCRALVFHVVGSLCCRQGMWCMGDPVVFEISGNKCCQVCSCTLTTCEYCHSTWCFCSACVLVH